MEPEEIRAVEDLVNAQIRRNLPIETNIMDLEAAKQKGAMALSARSMMSVYAC